MGLSIYGSDLIEPLYRLPRLSQDDGAELSGSILTPILYDNPCSLLKRHGDRRNGGFTIVFVKDLQARKKINDFI